MKVRGYNIFKDRFSSRRDLMIKGIKKSIIVVAPPKKSSFEKIFFVVKPKQAPSSSREMLEEANRIVGESAFGREGFRHTVRGRQLAAFGIGFLMGAALGMLVLLLML